jgi:mannose-1-phosphate guanylyltransferase
VLSPEIFSYIPDGRAVSIEREVFPRLAEAGKLAGCRIDGLWMDIGKPYEYLQANKTVLDAIGSKIVKPKADGVKINGPVALDRGVSIGENSLAYAIIGKNVKAHSSNINKSVIFPRI